jgi:N6-adenosine-specific RNA methylase IME4
MPATAPAPTDIERLHGQLERAETPAELTAVVDYAAAIADRAKRFRQALKSAKRDDTAFVDAARQVYGIEIEAAFARLEAICQIAGVLPGAGRPENSKAGLDFTAADFGISAVTAAQWKRWAQRAAALAVPALHARWVTKPDGDPKGWDDPAISRILWSPPPAPPDTPPLPDGRYRAIVIDPPWEMSTIERHVAPDQEPWLDYATMTIDELAELPITDLAASDGCHVYLWVTHKHLPDGLDLLEQWGARYECVMTWRKNVGMTPYSWMYDTEHVLFARVGSALPLLRNGLRLSFDAPTTGHSVKPDAFYERVMEASPGPRLDMFARREREGFTAWGAEVPA